MKEAPERTPQGGERWIVLAFMALFVAALGADLLREFTPVKLSIVFMAAALVPLVAIHEAGHAVVAAGLGWRVCRVVIGIGRPLLRLTVRGVPVEIRSVPLSGYMQPAPTEIRSPRLESFLIYAAGPAAEAVIAVALLMLIPEEQRFSLGQSLPVIAAQSIALLVAVDLFFNLVPLPAEVDGGITDGLGMLLAPLRSDAHFHESMTTPWRNEARAFEEAGQLESAASLYRRAVERHPDNPFLRALYAIALDRAGHRAQAVEEAKTALTSPLLEDEDGDEVRALLRDLAGD